MDETNEAWFSRARKVIPGGVDSPVRSFASVGGTPYTVVRGDGPYVYDVEGKRYIDLVQSYGAVLLGHAHPLVTKAIAEAAGKGTTFGAPTPGEVELAEAICERVPGCEQVRLVSSGTEASTTSLRVSLLVRTSPCVPCSAPRAHSKDFLETFGIATLTDIHRR